jgi:hypothetical protein
MLHELHSFLVLPDYLTLESTTRPSYLPPSSSLPSSSSYFLHSCLQQWYDNTSHLSLPPALARSLVKQLVAGVPLTLEERRRKKREGGREGGRKKRNNESGGEEEGVEGEEGGREGGREGGMSPRGGETDTESTGSLTPPPPLLLLGQHSPSSFPSSLHSSPPSYQNFMLAGRSRQNPYLTNEEEDEEGREEEAAAAAAERKRMSDGIPHPARVRPLLAACLGASSQDRQEESAENTLRPSVCMATLGG